MPLPLRKICQACWREALAAAPPALASPGNFVVIGESNYAFPVMLIIEQSSRTEIDKGLDRADVRHKYIYK